MRLILIIIRILAGRAICPALLCKSDICPHGLRASVHVRIRQFLVVCKSYPKNFYSVQIRQWIFLKTPAITNYVRILWDMCISDMIFLGIRCANPTIFLWLRLEGVWLCEFGEKMREREKIRGDVDGAAVRAWNAWFAAFLGIMWDVLARIEISGDSAKFY